MQSGGDGSDIGAVENGLPQSGPNYVVTSTNSGGPFESDGVCTNDECSLQEALLASNANPDANTIFFRRDVRGSITTQFTNGFSITQPVTIVGPGARILSVNGGNAARIFNVSGPNVTISGLTLTSGRVFAANGAAVQNTGGLTLVNCSLTNHTATASTTSGGLGGAIYNASGATLALLGCTLRGNSAGQFGGGVYNEGALTVTNCTFAFNTALRGGGLMSRANDAQSSMLLRNSTIANNSATDGAATAGGGGCSVEGAAAQHHVGNTIIAGNSSTNNPDVRGDYASDGHNLIGNKGTSTGFNDGVNGDQVGGGSLPTKPANLATSGTTAARPTRSRRPPQARCAMRPMMRLRPRPISGDIPVSAAAISARWNSAAGISRSPRSRAPAAPTLWSVSRKPSPAVAIVSNGSCS
jgi:hypothetical protein